jgi:SnoaL-like domain
MTEITRRLLDAIARRDFDAIAQCFTEDASVRVLTPRRVRELAGRGETADRFRAWFADMEEFEVVSSGAAPIADRLRIRWHTRGRDPEEGWRENEHTGYAEVRDGLIASLNVSCAGFRPADRP